MLSATLPIPKSTGHAMIVGAALSDSGAGEVLNQMGYEVDFRDDPYAAMLELCRRPLVFRTLVLSLAATYRDELSIIATVRRRFPHLTVWVMHTDGRQAALAEAMRLGAEAILTDDAVYPFTDDVPAMPAVNKPLQFRPVPVQNDAPPEKYVAATATAEYDRHYVSNEPVLSADELRALLGDEMT